MTLAGRLSWRIRHFRAVWHLPGARIFAVLLLAFLVFCGVCSWAFYDSYVNPLDGTGLTPLQSVYAVFTLLTIQPSFPLPREWPVATLFFLVPVMSIIIVGGGLVRLASEIFDKVAWEKAMASTYENHVVICGLGRVGYRTTRWLLDLGECVVGIESGGEMRFLEEIRAWNVPVLALDAQVPENLVQAGIQTARAVVPCTNNDLVNLTIALEARRLNPGIRVVLRMFDERLAANIKHGFDIHMSYSVAALVAPAFAAAASRAPVDYAFSFGGEDGRPKVLLTICKFMVAEGSPFVGWTVEKLENEFDVSVIMHRRGEAADLHPRGGVTFAAGDGFVVSAELDALDRISKLTPTAQEYFRQKRAASKAPA